jgi:fused signal recognition particle receptor
VNSRRKPDTLHTTGTCPALRHKHEWPEDELEKVRRTIDKRIPGAPHHTWLVIDGTNGQNAIQQAKEFTSRVAVTGLIVAKLDGTARGGAVFGIREALGLPVRYIGTGEQLELLEPFEPEAFVDAIVSRAVGGA